MFGPHLLSIQEFDYAAPLRTPNGCGLYQLTESSTSDVQYILSVLGQNSCERAAVQLPKHRPV